MVKKDDQLHVQTTKNNERFPFGVSGNSISESGAVAIGDALKSNISLTELNMNGKLSNPICIPVCLMQHLIFHDIIRK